MAAIVNSGNRELSSRLMAGGRTQRRAIGHIFHTLEQHGWNLTHAAPALGVSVRTLQHWLRRFPVLAQGRYNAARGIATQELRKSAIDFVATIPED